MAIQDININSTSMSNLKFILSGGGTGGHIYPAIAIANELKIRFIDCEILFVGAADKMEMQKVPEAGYQIKGLWIAGIQRKLTFENLKFPFKLLSSLIKSRAIINDFRPNIVIGTGGFASGPLLKMASMMGIPTVIQEQNSYPGITNKWLSKHAAAICVAYQNLEQFFPADKIKLTGNPVRQGLLDIDSKRQHGIEFFGLNSNKKTILVLGGSLGARRINQLLASEIDFVLDQNTQIIWQCGKLYFDEYKHFSDKPNVQVSAFINQMDLAYAASDIIISRSGASSVSELAIVGKPVIFIPSPNVAEDHQTKNAKAISDNDGAIMIKEKDLDLDFQAVLKELLTNEKQQESLGKNFKKLAKPNATHDIVDVIKALVKKQNK